MNRILKLFWTLLLLAVVFPTFAEEYDYDDPLLVYGKTPSRMLSSECAKVKSPTSLCNQGAESFSSFLRKFKSDKKFCISRISKDEQPGMGDPEYNIETISEFKFPVYRRESRCNRGYATWYNVQKDKVYYFLGDDLICGEDGGSAYYFLFQRIDGKWYLTNYLMAG
ncbi:MAG: hypothetical protein K2M31_02780 [Muribaculaceae bacterium]|nr:hypothetical protein [Muribaculaceae bacterium]